MDGKRWVNSKCSVMVEGIELADRLDMEKVRDERITDPIRSKRLSLLQGPLCQQFAAWLFASSRSIGESVHASVLRQSLNNT